TASHNNNIDNMDDVPNLEPRRTSETSSNSTNTTHRSPISSLGSNTINSASTPHSHFMSSSMSSPMSKYTGNSTPMTAVSSNTGTPKKIDALLADLDDLLRENSLFDDGMDNRNQQQQQLDKGDYGVDEFGNAPSLTIESPTIAELLSGSFSEEGAEVTRGFMSKLSLS
ncbi:hypothetical protein HDU76_011642, partial [Blyttiomyces sp. JEL0837]